MALTDDEKKNRECGFYWVSTGWGLWEVAKWEPSWRGYNQWTVLGEELYYDDDIWDEIDEKKITR